MLVLAMDTSTPSVTAGVVVLAQPHELMAAQVAHLENPAVGRPSAAPRPVRLLAEQSVTDQFAHAEKLMPLVQAALALAGVRLASIEAVVVGLGPGPFTGLRVGIATAQALGDALDIPVHGVASHDGVALADVDVSDVDLSDVDVSDVDGAQVDGAQVDAAEVDAAEVGPSAVGGAFLVVTDARRREVYLSAYSATGARLFGPVVLAPSAVPELLAAQGVEPSRLTGAGADLLNGSLPQLAATAGRGSVSLGLVRAAVLPLLTGVVPGPLTPLYLRRPDAIEPGARKSVLGP